MNEFKKKQKKQGLYRLFVVCWQTAKSFAISQQTAKLPRGNYLCNLGAGLFGYFAVLWQKVKMKWSLAFASRRQRTWTAHVAAYGR